MTFTIILLFLIIILLFIVISRVNVLTNKMKQLEESTHSFLKNSQAETTYSPLVVVTPPPLPSIPLPKEVEIDAIEEEQFEEEEESMEKFEETPETAPEFIPQKPKRKINYEKYIGENLFGKIGILVLVIGIGLFVKYAIDNEWINEQIRTLLGFVVGSILLFVAERLQKNYRTFSSLLAGGAFAIFYVTVAVAYHYYALFSQTVAFLILVAITVLMTVLASIYNRRELAIISLVGGFTAPFLVSSGSGNDVVLFSYIAILNVGMFLLSFRKKWIELPVICFFATYLIMGLFSTRVPFDEGGEAISFASTRLLLFATLFYFTFLLPIISIVKGEGKINTLLLSVIALNNFIYLGYGLKYLNHIQTPVAMGGLLALFIAVVNLLVLLYLLKNRKEKSALIYTILAVTLSFVSLAVPIQLEGNYITLFWATEMVLFLWLFQKSKIVIYKYGTIAITILTGISFLMDLENDWFSEAITPFANTMFITDLYTSLAFLAAGWLLHKEKENKLWDATMFIVGSLMFYVTFFREFDTLYRNEDIFQMICAFTNFYLLTWAIVFRKRFPAPNVPLLYNLGMALSVLMAAVYFRENAPLYWAGAACSVSLLFIVGKQIHSTAKQVVYLNILAVILWSAMVQNLAGQLFHVTSASALFSLSLLTIAVAQMAIGMKFHIKLMRGISVIVFGIILLKLVAFDLWSMNSAGKITVLICFGIILLALSFLYQKLKNVLFKDED